MNLKLVNQVYKGMHQVIILKRNVDRRIIIAQIIMLHECYRNGHWRSS